MKATTARGSLTCQLAALALPLVVVCGCNVETGTFAFVTVKLGETVSGAAIVQLRSTAENGSATDVALFPRTAGAPLVFAPTKSYVIELGSRRGELTVKVEGLGADSKALAQGVVKATIKPGRQSTLSVTLEQACAATAFCKEVPAQASLWVQGSPDRLNGCAVAAGPLLGRGGDDMIVGARQEGGNGLVYVIPGLQDLTKPQYALGSAPYPYRVMIRLLCPADGTDEMKPPPPSTLNPCSEALFGNAVLATQFVTTRTGAVRPDLVIGAFGGDAVFFVPAEMLPLQPTGLTEISLGVRPAPYTLIRGPQGSHFGLALAAGILGQDGKPALVVGANLADGARGRVYVIPNSIVTGGGVVDLSGQVPLPAGVMVISGTSAGDKVGTAVAVGDVIGDEAPDLVVSAPFGNGFDGSLTSAGAVHLFTGPFDLVAGTQVDVGAADLTFGGAASGDQLGMAVTVGPFVTGDRGDLMLGAPGAQTVHVFSGPLSGGPPWDLRSQPATSRITGGGPAFGASLALVDVTGDGVVDLVVGAPAKAPELSRVVVMRGGALASALVDFHGEPRDYPGAEIVVTGASSYGVGAAMAGAAQAGASSRDLLIGAPDGASVFVVSWPR
jgi:hypothetical protein